MKYIEILLFTFAYSVALIIPGITHAEEFIITSGPRPSAERNLKMITESYIKAIFSNLENGQADKFLEFVSDDVRWEVTGTHPLAGIYTSKASFVEGTIMRLNKIMKDGVRLKYLGCITDGTQAAVELESVSTALNGKPYNNRYCWVCKFEDGIITSVRAYVDSALVATTIDENEK